MKPFVINRYGRMVFAFNFPPELDFSVFETLERPRCGPTERGTIHDRR